MKPDGQFTEFHLPGQAFFFHVWILFGNSQPKLYDHLILQWGIKSWWFWWRSMLSSKFVPLPVVTNDRAFLPPVNVEIYIMLYTNHSLELAFCFFLTGRLQTLYSEWVGSLASLFKTLNLARSLMGCVRRVVGRVLSGGLSAYGSFWCFILGYVSVMGFGQFYRYWVDRDG